MAIAARPTGKIINTAASATFKPTHLFLCSEGSGTTLTDAAGSSDGTISGPDWASDATHGSVLSFVGANSDYVSWASSLLGAEGGTLAAVVKIPNSHASEGAIASIADGGTTNKYADVRVQTDDLLASFINPGVSLNSTASDAANDQWVFVAWKIGDNMHGASMNGAAFTVATPTIDFSSAITPNVTRLGSTADSTPLAYATMEVAAVWTIPGVYWSDADVASAYNSEDPWSVFLTDPSTAAAGSLAGARSLVTGALA